MSCEFDKDLVFEFALGDADSAVRREVEAHLAHCEECRMEVAGHRQLARDLAALSEPQFPYDLEEVLVRASIQTGKNLAPRPAPRGFLGLRPAWALALGGMAGVTVLILLVLLLWPGRLSTLQPAGQVGGGGVGQSVGLMDGVLRWVNDLQEAWRVVTDFLARFEPVTRAFRLALRSVGGTIWVALATGALAAVLFVWRIAGSGHKKVRRVGHAKPR